MKENKSKCRIWWPVIVVAAVAVGIFLGRYLPQRQHDPNEAIFRDAKLEDDKLYEVLQRIYSQYVDVPRMDSIEEVLLPILLENLDPHSAYISAKDLASVNESIEGQFDGIGVTFNMLDDTVRVITVIGGGPSARAGIQPGDRIRTIDGENVAGQQINQDNIVKRLRGPRDTKVDLGIERQGVTGLFPITVTRGVVPMKSVSAAYMVDDTTGYLRLTVFSRTSHTEVVQIANAMKSLGMRRLIFDLRGNGGGLLDQAILIANEFLPKEALIVYTEGRASRRREQHANGVGTLQDILPIVLIDESSASASEIVAGALQDNDRGTIVGRRSFGKGLVQEQIGLTDGSALRLTVARYYTPVGRNIQKPYEAGPDEYKNDLKNRFAHSEFFSADSIQFSDSERFTTPAGKVVYGGGGIMPDVFVPLDTLPDNPYLVQVVNRNIAFQYSVQYADNHRVALNTIKALEDLDAFFDADPDLLAGLVRYAAARDVRPAGDDLAVSRDELTAILKSYIGRNTPLEDNATAYYLLPYEPEFEAALAVE